MCFVNRVSYVKHTDPKVRFWSDGLHGTLGRFGGDLVVTRTFRGPCAGLAVLCGAYGSLGVPRGACPAYRVRFTPHTPRNPLHKKGYNECQYSHLLHFLHFLHLVLELWIRFQKTFCRF